MCRLTFVGLKKYVVPCEGMRACGVQEIED